MQIVQDILAKKCCLGMAITGGGSEAIGYLLRHGGGSKVLVNATVPYDQRAFIDYVGGTTSDYKFNSSDAALDLAMASFQQILKHKDAYAAMGIGVTCSLAKENERPDREHSCYIAIQTVHFSKYVYIKLTKASREEQEHAVSEFILQEIYQALQEKRISYDRDIEYQETHTATAFEIHLFLNLSRYMINRDVEPENLLIYPGSFNPLHEGHLKIAEKAEKIIGKPVFFELSIRNADKPMLNYFSVKERIVKFPNYILTNLPYFWQKVQTFPNSTFIVGSDTMQRIADPKYAEYSRFLEGEKLVEFFASYGTKFLVFLRKKNGITPEFSLPPIWDKIVKVENAEDIPELSSTKIRKSDIAKN